MACKGKQWRCYSVLRSYRGAAGWAGVRMHTRMRACPRTLRENQDRVEMHLKCFAWRSYAPKALKRKLLFLKKHCAFKVVMATNATEFMKASFMSFPFHSHSQLTLCGIEAFILIIRMFLNRELVTSGESKAICRWPGSWVSRLARMGGIDGCYAVHRYYKYLEPANMIQQTEHPTRSKEAWIQVSI